MDSKIGLIDNSESVAQGYWGEAMRGFSYARVERGSYTGRTFMKHHLLVVGMKTYTCSESSTRLQKIKRQL